MKTGVYLNEISDGKIYEIDDLAQVDAKGCHGCSACCEDVGDLVALTPYDFFNLKRITHLDSKTLLSEKCTLVAEEKLALPFLKMVGDAKRCVFLNEESRCTVHPNRPNICRLFPLGRFYADGDFGYFLQTKACVKDDLKAIRVRNWIDINDYDDNKLFLLSWYAFNKALQFRMKFVRDESDIASIQSKILSTVYDIDATDDMAFYDQFSKQLSTLKKELGLL